MHRNLLFDVGVYRMKRIFACSDWHKIVILYCVQFYVMPHTAHRPSLLQQAAAAEYTSRAEVHVESFF